MNVLIGYASRHKATEEIAQVIGSRLREAGLTVDVAHVADVRRVEPFDAVILGSAVYMGHWLDEARRAVARLGPDLQRRAVWLFSSGPLGDPPVPADPPADLEGLMTVSGAREHRTFGGRLEREDLGHLEKLAVRMVHAPEGDYRDFDDIQRWADSVVEQLIGVRAG